MLFLPCRAVRCDGKSSRLGVMDLNFRHQLSGDLVSSQPLSGLQYPCLSNGGGLAGCDMWQVIITGFPLRDLCLNSGSATLLNVSISQRLH